MTREAENSVPPLRRGPTDLFNIAGRIALALALAIAIFLGPSQISAAAPDLTSATAKAHDHHDDHADAGHDAANAATNRHHAAAVSFYCNALTPGDSSSAEHGHEMCEGSRVMSSTLAGTDFDKERYFILLGMELYSSSLPPNRSPESIEEPPRTAA